MNKYILLPANSDLNRGDQALVWETKRVAEKAGYNGEFFMLADGSKSTKQSQEKELLAIADIFLFTTYQEGLPRSLMEAMAAGLPVICSDIRGNTDLIIGGKGGYLCGPNDVNALAKFIDILANNENLRIEMGNFNLEVVKAFDIENVQKEMKKIYCEVLAIE